MKAVLTVPIIEVIAVSPLPDNTHFAPVAGALSLRSGGSEQPRRQCRRADQRWRRPAIGARPRTAKFPQ